MIGIIKQWINKHRAILYVLVLFAGIFTGYLIFAPSGRKDKTEQSDKRIYTCSMHPQIRQEKEGKCPLCGMDLTPLGQTSNNNVDENAVMLTDEAAALANIETMVVWEEDGEKSLTLYGNIDVNQRSVQIQTAYVNGRIEKLNITAVGDRVTRGQTVATIYSPEVYTATQELVSALEYPDERQREMMIRAAKEKLLLWNLTPAQIDNIIATKKATPFVELKANTSGVVVEKNVNQGDYISQGKALFKVADLSNLWLVLKAYEKDLPFLKVGQTVNFSCEALQGKEFKGRISYIDAFVDAKKRTADVRVELSNGKGELKPNMYVTANVIADLKDYKGKIIIPKSAVLWSGKKSVVYVKDAEQEQPTFAMREVELGPAINGAYIVLSGLNEGEELVTNGVFQIDATAQLEGKRSFSNR
ncbi:MAG: efflux RND transporter periplasmic adaptor subunit [Bacteroidales bacterium]|nr:efflux RND transporter periplasmic adaptor subunit [Bacteroidales bacterium]